MKSINLLLCFLWASVILGAIATPMLGRMKSKGKKDAKTIGSTSNSNNPENIRGTAEWMAKNRHKLHWQDGEYWEDNGKWLVSMDQQRMRTYNYADDIKEIEARETQQRGNRS